MNQPQTFRELAQDWRTEAARLDELRGVEIVIGACALQLEALIDEWERLSYQEGEEPVFAKRILGVKGK